MIYRLQQKRSCQIFRKSTVLSSSELDHETADIKTLTMKYSKDLDNECADKLVQFCLFFKKIRDASRSSSTRQVTPQMILQFIKDNNLNNTFPNLTTALQIYLTFPVTIYEGERSFSKLSLIKNRLTSTMTDKRLNALCILSIESNVLRELNLDDLINEFSYKKLRKQTI